jgi:hypothetical protein
VTATTDLMTSVQWSQPATVGTAFDPNLVRQGRALNPSDSYTRPGGAGTLTVTWTLANTSVSWDGVGPIGFGSPSFSASGPCALLAGGPDYSCSLSSSQQTLVDGYINDLIGGVPGPYVKLALGANVTISPQGLATLRSTTFGGNPGPSAALTLGESPITDNLSIPCTVGAGDDLSYSLGSLSATDGVSVDSSLNFDVGAETPVPTFIPPFTEVDVSFAKPSIDLGTVSNNVSLSGPGATFDMGNVQPNNVPPVANAGGPYSGNEGSPITFDGSGSSSICGFPTLRWDFSDGGVAFGESPQHTFEGPGVFSGLLTATDATGLTSTTTFSVTVNNLPPVATAGPNMITEWGVPVTLNGSAVDPGTAEQPFLTYAWDFGDGSGSGGASVTHTYATPNTYTATFSACDPEAACSTPTTQVQVNERGTTLSYTGVTTSDVTDSATFNASLIDDQGQPVVGRTVDYFADGSAVPFASAATNSFGHAIATFAFPNGAVGLHAIVAQFAGDSMYLSSSSLPAVSFTVNQDGTDLVYGGPLSSLPSKALTLSAILTDDSGRALPGMTVTFTLGTQSCSGVTNATGVATCTIAKLVQKTGAYTLTSKYAGNGDYLATTTNTAFVVGK